MCRYRHACTYHSNIAETRKWQELHLSVSKFSRSLHSPFKALIFTWHCWIVWYFTTFCAIFLTTALICTGPLAASRFHPGSMYWSESLPPLLTKTTYTVPFVHTSYRGMPQTGFHSSWVPDPQASSETGLKSLKPFSEANKLHMLRSVLITSVRPCYKGVMGIQHQCWCIFVYECMS